MLQWIFVAIMALHGLIHTIGFLDEFNLAEFDGATGKTLIQLPNPIRTVFGVLWLLVVFLFLGASYGFVFGKYWWVLVTITAIVLSQILVVLWWQDAKMGTVANILIILGLVYFII